MLKKLLPILFIGLSLSATSQYRLTEFENSLKTSSSDIKDVIPVVDEIKDEIGLFIADAKNIYAYKLDKDFNVIEKLASPSKKRKYKVLLGSSISENGDYRIFASNKDQNQFVTVNFSFKNQTSDIKEFKIKQFEDFIQTISYKNKFYMITGSRSKKSLSVYTFDDNGEVKRNRINHNSLFYVDKSGKKVVKVTDLLIDYNDLKKFEENTPNAIEAVSDSRKMYLRGNEAVFTFDINKEKTQVLVLNLDSLTVKDKTFKKPLLDIKSNRKKTNSFIHEDKIYTIAANKELFSMEVLDYNTGDFIKNYTFKKEDKIAFKNTPIIQEGGMYNGYRELEKTKRFLRKITSQKIGVSVIKNNGDYQFTIGGYVTQRTGGGMMMPMGFGGIPIGAIGGSVTVFVNPTALAYNSFTSTKSTRIECLFDADLNHIKDKKVSDNAFDKIKNASKSNNKAASTVFRYKDFFIKGDYDTWTKKYVLRKFTN